MGIHTDEKHCAALLYSVPAGDAGVILTFNRKSSLVSAE